MNLSHYLAVGYIGLCLSQAQADELWLKVGEVHKLPAEAGKAVRVGTKGVIRVIDGENSVRVVGLKPGLATVVVGDAIHNVHVSFSKQRQFAQALHLRVQKMMGLKVELDAQPPVVSGTLLRFSDWLSLEALARQYQGDYIFKARPLDDVATVALNHLQNLARQKGLPIVAFKANPELVAEIPNAAAGLRQQAQALFRYYGIQVEQNQSRLMLQPLIRTHVILAEVARDLSREIGIKWPTEYSAQLLPQVKGGGNSLEVTLKGLEDRGQAQILASPNLLCRSGGEASFHAGGEFPVRIYSLHSHDVSWKEHGVILNVKPEADFSGAISLEIETEVSVLDMANSVEGMPALKTNSVRSHFDLPGRRTVALSGLLRQEVGEGREGLPFLTGIPILGALFSSQNYRRHQSELVIFVTPEVHVPDSDEPIEMPKGWIQDVAG